MSEKLQVVLNFMDRVKWWLLLVVVLGALIAGGATPDQLIEWTKSLLENIKIS